MHTFVFFFFVSDEHFRARVLPVWQLSPRTYTQTFSHAPSEAEELFLRAADQSQERSHDSWFGLTNGRGSTGHPGEKCLSLLDSMVRCERNDVNTQVHEIFQPLLDVSAIKLRKSIIFGQFVKFHTSYDIYCRLMS